MKILRSLSMVVFVLPIICSQAEARVVFETNFDNDSGWSSKPTSNLWQTSGMPTGWDGYRCIGASTQMSVISGAGLSGSNALRLAWSPTAAQPTVNLVKHLSGSIGTGYDELFVRYRVRLPDKFKAGADGTNAPYWKWGRLYQNTAPEGPASGTWTENRVDSSYVVWNFGGDTQYGIDLNVSWADNTGVNLHKGSAGGEQVKIDYYVSGAVLNKQSGYFQSVGGGAWDINKTDRPGELVMNSGQAWHTLEFRFKLATSVTAQDGVFEVWFDGIKQGNWTRIRSHFGAPEYQGIPTARNGSGFNFLVFFDNLSGWNEHWGNDSVDGYIDVNDVVVSTEYIGPDYQARNSDWKNPPVTPAGIIIK